MADERGEMNEEALRASHAELSAFARRLAHDMGAPLRTIQGFAEVLMLTARDQLSGETAGQLEKLGAAATRLDTMIKALGQYARIGPTQPPAEPTDLTDVAHSAWELLAQDVEQHGAQLDIEELPCLPIAEAPLRSIFLNLFDNALRYRSDQPPHVIVSAASCSGELRISVVDNGAGIAHDMVDWALTPGCAGDNGTGSAGMGLAIARAHVEAHGGTFGLEESGSGGTRVWFTLPRVRDSGVAQRAAG